MLCMPVLGRTAGALPISGSLVFGGVGGVIAGEIAGGYGERTGEVLYEY